MSERIPAVATQHPNPNRIAIFIPLRNAVSETFIRNHVDYLPYTTIPRYGTELGITDEEGTPIWRGAYLLGRIIARFSPSLRDQLRDFLLSRHLRSLGVTAVLAEYGVTGCWLISACKRAKIPLVVHFHGFDAYVRDVITQYHQSYQDLFRSAAAIIVVSHAMREKLISLGATEEKLFLNPYGVNELLFDSARPASQPARFLAVGRFVEKKAPYLTILAFNYVFQNVPDASLILIGEGPLLGPCKRLAQSLGLSGSVKFPGSRPPDYVAAQIKKSRAFVQHSLEADNGDCEGTPVAVLEAQMSGIPVIATKHAGIPDVVVDGSTGFLVEESDVNGMAEAMIRIAKNPDLAGKMGIAARQRALSNYTLDRHINELAKIIERVRV